MSPDLRTHIIPPTPNNATRLRRDQSFADGWTGRLFTAIHAINLRRTLCTLDTDRSPTYRAMTLSSSPSHRCIVWHASLRAMTTLSAWLRLAMACAVVPWSLAA